MLSDPCHVYVFDCMGTGNKKCLSGIVCTKQALNAVVDFEKSFLYNVYTVTKLCLVVVRFTPSWEFSYHVGTGNTN